MAVTSTLRRQRATTTTHRLKKVHRTLPNLKINPSKYALPRIEVVRFAIVAMVHEKSPGKQLYYLVFLVLTSLLLPPLAPSPLARPRP